MQKTRDFGFSAAMRYSGNSYLGLMLKVINVFSLKTPFSGVMTIFFFLGVFFSFNYSIILYQDEFPDGVGQTMDSDINTPLYFECTSDMGCVVGATELLNHASIQIYDIVPALKVVGYFEQNSTLVSVGTFRSGNELRLPMMYIGTEENVTATRVINSDGVDTWFLGYSELSRDSVCDSCVSVWIKFEPVSVIIYPMREVDWLLIFGTTSLNSVMAYIACFSVVFPLKLIRKMRDIDFTPNDTETLT